MPRPIVDGEELPEGYGTYFEQTLSPLHAAILDAQGRISRAPSTLRAWVTKQNWKGEYNKYREVTGLPIQVWDEDGRAWEYDGVTIQIIEDNIDFEKEYGDEYTIAEDEC